MLKPKHYGLKEYLLKLPKIWSGDFLDEACEGVSVVNGKPIPSGTHRYPTSPSQVDTEAYFFLIPDEFKPSVDKGYFEKGVHYSERNHASYNWADDAFDPKTLKEVIYKVAG